MGSIKQTKQWVEQIVVGLNLCPFAKVPFNKNLIRYVLFEGTDMESLIHLVISELETLTKTSSTEIETTLLVTPNVLQEFEEYLDLFHLLNDVLEKLNLEGILQIASFHPNYLFEGSNLYDVENFTNRSPYPMFHLIRENSIEKAVESYKNPEEIPEKNMETMRYLGLEKIKTILNEIKRTH